MVDDNLLPREGRHVRCISCQHTWLQTPLEEKTPILTLTESEDIYLEQRPPLQKKASWKVWCLVFSFFILVASFVIYGREMVIKIWPKSESFYALAGLSINHPGEDLSILNTSSFVQLEGSNETVYIVGDIVNTANQVRSIPTLKIKLLGPLSLTQCKEKEGKYCLLDSWNHRLSENSLLPGEKIHFETEAHPTPSGTHHISIQF
ncbi:MAG: hypothetical protein A2W46_01600 [Alphaproteobacteria bacterium RIFCSPHIGHO2_12_42_13]|nr:MAG: hypothetical protein A2Z80_05410 [Alphaproteobacteria bacterium GWA2_41_27]OFW93470.1 MAG: hypothetical protein A2W46_01600 [Alphaproteobacteria bacterium RIFCSPHIGHO2_12_42_13]OFX04674.1 MAG: hypothetical protein A3H46_03895 [Alphaproteobacteria bacterium RIFCSPLOWO2_02_FULL_43_54]OFX07452.1 MAG: hypothetical protein A3G78_01485 [Alphaproteobacteria bacterium RIFCSPLOWO2_12_FULL_42_29]